MSAEIVENVEDELVHSKYGNFEEVLEETREAEAEERHEPEDYLADAVVEEIPDPDEDVPEQYRGKSKSELAKMLKDTQSQIGRQSNEIGEMRKVFDQFVQTQARQATHEPEPVQEVDYFTDPQAAVHRTIDQHPAVQEVQNLSRNMAMQNGIAQLRAMHPDMNNVLSSDEFKSWVKSSPARVRMYQDADQGMNVDMANELLTTFKQLQGAKSSVSEVSKRAQRSAVQGASTGASRSNQDGMRSTRVYSRAAIRKLMINDPERYDAEQPEILKAYAEGRVKG